MQTELIVSSMVVQCHNHPSVDSAHRHAWERPPAAAGILDTAIDESQLAGIDGLQEGSSAGSLGMHLMGEIASLVLEIALSAVVEIASALV